MLYSLVLVVFLSNGSEDRTTLVKNYQDDTCIESRDMLRSQLDYYNNLPKGSGKDVEFVDAECVAQKDFV
ncbi:hypothetical protein BRC2024_KCUCJSVR_CDS_0113 [Acinetobacter phage vB_AbaM_KissB]